MTRNALASQCIPGRTSAHGWVIVDESCLGDFGKGPTLHKVQSLTRGLIVIIDVLLKNEDGETLGKLLATEKNFASGSRGYFGQGKIEIAGKRYQTQVQLVEIGSKGAKKPEE